MEKILSFQAFNEARDINDPLLMDFRAGMDMRKKWAKEDEEREKKRLLKREEDKIASRKRRSLNLIEDKIVTLRIERKEVMQEMENNPDVEAEGGEVADQYGERLNKIDKEIEKLQAKKKIILNPVLKSKTLKDLNDKTGIFENE